MLGVSSRVSGARLISLVKRLRSFHGAPAAPPTRDPYRLILWEQVGYLADDVTRRAAYDRLEQEIGTDTEAILSAPVSSLRDIVKRGGAIAVEQRAERLRVVAKRVRDVWNGDLAPVLRLPLADARCELMRYPAIGEPGAERILLLTGAQPILGLDSNALRVLLRLGYGRECRQWAQTYRSVQGAADRELPPTVAARRPAFLLLRHHGQTICRRSAPRCRTCPLLSDCPTGREQAVSRDARAKTTRVKS